MWLWIQFCHLCCVLCCVFYILRVLLCFHPGVSAVQAAGSFHEVVVTAQQNSTFYNHWGVTEGAAQYWEANPVHVTVILFLTAALQRIEWRFLRSGFVNIIIFRLQSSAPMVVCCFLVSFFLNLVACFSCLCRKWKMFVKRCCHCWKGSSFYACLSRISNVLGDLLSFWRGLVDRCCLAIINLELALLCRLTGPLVLLSHQLFLEVWITDTQNKCVFFSLLCLAEKLCPFHM